MKLLPNYRHMSSGVFYSSGWEVISMVTPSSCYATVSSPAADLCSRVPHPNTVCLVKTFIIVFVNASTLTQTCKQNAIKIYLYSVSSNHSSLQALYRNQEPDPPKQATVSSTRLIRGPPPTDGQMGKGGEVENYR